MRILVTGSRNWSDKEVIAKALSDAWRDAGMPPDVTVVHGGATGADYIASVYAKRLGFATEPHKAAWDKYGRGAGPIRNKEMVESDVDICLAFIYNGSKGATGCANLAEQAGVPTIRFEE